MQNNALGIRRFHRLFYHPIELITGGSTSFVDLSLEEYLSVVDPDRVDDVLSRVLEVDHGDSLLPVCFIRQCKEHGCQHGRDICRNSSYLVGIYLLNKVLAGRAGGGRTHTPGGNGF